MNEEITMSIILNASAEKVCSAWLDAAEHSKFTGGEAIFSAEEEKEFTAWDGYITGNILEVEDGKSILHTWRTSEFGKEDEDSLLEITFENLEGGTCKLIIHHSNLPEGTGDKYKAGWQEHYFEPMAEYFNS